MFTKKINEEKCIKKINASLRIVSNTLNYLVKKRTELSMTGRKEIAKLIGDKKFDRARIKVELAIMDDYLIESMEMVEVYGDTMRARIGQFYNSELQDDALMRCVSSIVYSEAYLHIYVPELKSVVALIGLKKGPEFVQTAKLDRRGYVYPKLKDKLCVTVPKVKLIEAYMSMIAEKFNYPYTVDQRAIDADELKLSRSILDAETPQMITNEDFITLIPDTVPVTPTFEDAFNASSLPSYDIATIGKEFQLTDTKGGIESSDNNCNRIRDASTPCKPDTMHQNEPSTSKSNEKKSEKKQEIPQDTPYTPTPEDLSIEERLARLKRPN